MAGGPNVCAGSSSARGQLRLARCTICDREKRFRCTVDARRRGATQIPCRAAVRIAVLFRPRCCRQVCLKDGTPTHILRRPNPGSALSEPTPFRGVSGRACGWAELSLRHLEASLAMPRFGTVKPAIPRTRTQADTLPKDCRRLRAQRCPCHWQNLQSTGNRR
jgi:hypothetical protein